MRLTNDVKDDIMALFSVPGEPLSDKEIEEIASNLLAFALHIGDAKS